MNDGHLRGLHLLDQAADDQVLTATFWSTKNEVLVLFEQRSDHCDVFLDRWGLHHRRRFRVCEVLKLELLILLDECLPALLLRIKVVE